MAAPTAKTSSFATKKRFQEAVRGISGLELDPESIWGFVPLSQHLHQFAELLRQIVVGLQTHSEFRSTPGDGF